MNKSLQLLKKKRLIIPGALVFLFVLANSCMSLRTSDKEMVKDFSAYQLTPKIFHTVFQGKPMRYVASKPIDNQLPTLIFVHGAPGSSSDFYRYLRDADLNKKANLISVDRLGYGYSDYGHATTAITTQAQSIVQILSENKIKKVTLIGWSYGGPIVVKMAMSNPELVKHVVLIAPAISPKDEKYFALGKLAEWKLTRWMIPEIFKVAEDEKLTHANELELMRPDWIHISTPITYYHGDKDNIVPFANARFIKAQMPSDKLNLITIKGGSHFIAFKNFDMIKSELLRILDNF